MTSSSVASRLWCARSRGHIVATSVPLARLRVCGLRTLFVAVGEASPMCGFARMNRAIALPWPAAEAGALIVGEGLHDLGARIHDERTVLRNGLADRLPLQHEELGDVATVVCERGCGRWHHLRHRGRRQLHSAHAQR